MPFGLDSRAALTKDGAVEGFGNLGAALLMAPQEARKRQMMGEQHAEEMAFRDRQLAQALKMHDDEMALRRDELGRRQLSDFGSGLKNALELGSKAVGSVFGGNGKSSHSVNSGTGWHKDPNDDTYFRTTRDGSLERYDPKTKKTETSSGPTGMLGNAVNGVAPQAQVAKGPFVPDPADSYKPVLNPPGMEIPLSPSQQAADARNHRFDKTGSLLPDADALAARVAGNKAPVARGSQPQMDFSESEKQAVMALSPQAKQSLQKIIAEGDPKKVAEARRRLAQMGGGAAIAKAP